MTEVEIALSHAQRQFAADPHPVKVLIGGRRSGKSLTMKSMLTKTGLETPGRSVVVMPIQTNSNDFFTEMYQDSEVATFEDDFDPDSEYAFDQFLECKPKAWPYPLMTFRGTRHRLAFRSFENPQRLRGGNITGLCVCDEANDLNGDEVIRVLMSKILDTKAQMIITSSITHWNWLWDLYLRGQTNDKLVKSWLWRTPDSPAFQGDSGKQRLADFRSLFTEWQWNAEMLCIPGTDNTAIFPYLDQCCDRAPIPPEKPQSGMVYIGGLDLGRVQDHEELIILEYDPDMNTAQVVLHDSFELGLTHEVMAQRVAARSRYWGARIVADATGAGGSGGARSGDDSHILTYKAALPEDMLRPLFWSPNADSKSKRDIISHLSLMTEQARIQINKDKFPKLIGQMKRYKLLVKNGRIQGFGCTDGHDDSVAALASGMWGIKQGWIGSQGGIPLSAAQ